MNWKTYSKLKPKLQKEYDVRFRHFPYPNVSSYITWLFLIMVTVTVLVFTSYLAVTDDKFIEHKEGAIETLGAALNLVNIGGWVFITLGIIDGTRMLSYIISYNRWKKKNKIKIETFISKWKMLKIR